MIDSFSPQPFNDFLQSVAAATATVTTLVSGPVTGISDANGINNVGSVVGQGDTVFPYLWKPTQPNGTTGTATQLPSLPTGGAPGSAIAYAINNSDLVVGNSEGLDANGNAVTRAVYWVNGAIQDLGTLLPDPFNPGAFLGNSRAIDVNDAGQIVGASDTASGVEHAFLFDPAAGTMRDLGALVPLAMIPGTADPSRATSINNNGDVVGVAAAISASGAVVDHAFLLPAGAFTMVDLGTLPDPANPGNFLDNSSAFGINDNGMIVGTADAGLDPSGNLLTAAVLFTTGAGPVSQLPVQSEGYDIGPGNQIVGTFDIPGRGFVQDPATGLVDLTTLAGIAVSSGTGVNSAGQIIAIADVGGSTVGVLITP